MDSGDNSDRYLHWEPVKKKKKSPWQRAKDVLYYIMFNEENELTENLLNLICEGIEVPTDEEAEEAHRVPQGNDLVL